MHRYKCVYTQVHACMRAAQFTYAHAQFFFLLGMPFKQQTTTCSERDQPGTFRVQENIHATICF